MEQMHFNLSLAERDRRWAAIREGMAKAGMDVMIVQANPAELRYIANVNWSFSMEHIIFPLEGDPIIIQHGKDWKHINCGWISHYELFDGTADQCARLAKPFDKGGKIGLLRGSGQGVGNMPLQYDFYTSLTAAFGDRLVQADAMYIKIVQIASPEEIECLRRSADICDKAFHNVLDHGLAAGTCDFDICAEAMKIYYENGNDGDQMLWIEAGPDDNIGYGRPLGNRLAKDTSMVIEFAPGYNGYYSEIVFSLPVDKKMTPFMREKYKIWQEAFYAGKEKIVVGNRVCDVAYAIEEVYKKYGIGLRPDYGHGIGLTVCMGWGFSTFDKTELRPDMGIVLHPKVTDENNQGVFTGMHYILRENGLEPLGGYDYESFVDNMIKTW